MFELPRRHEVAIALGGPFVIMGVNQVALSLFANRTDASTWQAAVCLALFIPIQALALAIMCGAMRRRGFRLTKATGSETSRDKSENVRSLQFNIKETLLVMAVVGVSLTVARFSMSLQRVGYPNLLPWAVAFEALLGVLMATVLFSAILLAAGTPSLEVRLEIWVGVTMLVGVAVSLFSSVAVHLAQSQNWWMFYVQFGWLISYEWWWLVWLSLASGFLAATLWFLRELGYRLTRNQAPP